MVANTRIDLPLRQIEAFCLKYGVEEFALFGSVLRDDFGPESDVDVMLKFKPGHGFTFENTPDIQEDLETMFGRPVDVIEKGRIRNRFRREAIMNTIGWSMPRERNDPARDAAWLLDMLTAARAVCSFVTGRTFEQYSADLLFRSGVERQVEIIGEAARGISASFRTAHPEIPWRPIMAQRHRLAHDYGEINDALIWTVATVHVPKLIEQIEPLIPPPATPPGGSGV